MQIMPINNVTFKSFLPPESKVEKGDQTRDYWEEFSKECAKNSQQKEKLDSLLQDLMVNGDNNILALETTKGLTNGFQHNYYFRLYANNNDLMADRKEINLTDRNRDLTKRVWIQPYGNMYSFTEVAGDFEFGDKDKYFTAPGLTAALLIALEKIVNDPQKRMFDLKNINTAKYLKQFRAKV